MLADKCLFLKLGVTKDITVGVTIELMYVDLTSTVIVAENSVCTVNEAAGRIVIAERLVQKHPFIQPHRGLPEDKMFSEKPDRDVRQLYQTVQYRDALMSLVLANIHSKTPHIVLFYYTHYKFMTASKNKSIKQFAFHIITNRFRKILVYVIQIYHT